MPSDDLCETPTDAAKTLQSTQERSATQALMLVFALTVREEAHPPLTAFSLFQLGYDHLPLSALA